VLQDEAAHWRSYTAQLQESGARLAASETKAQTDLKLSQAELVKQTHALKSTEGQLNMVQTELHACFTRFQQMEDQLSAENARLTTALAGSKAENDKLRIELADAKALANKQSLVISARESELNQRNEERLKLLANLSQMQKRAEVAEADLKTTTTNLKVSQEHLGLTSAENHKLQLALGEASTRELQLQEKLNLTEAEYRRWLTTAKAQQDAEEARLRLALKGTILPAAYYPASYPVSFPASYSLTRSKLDEALALERLQAANELNKKITEQIVNS